MVQESSASSVGKAIILSGYATIVPLMASRSSHALIARRRVSRTTTTSSIIRRSRTSRKIGADSEWLVKLSHGHSAALCTASRSINYSETARFSDAQRHTDASCASCASAALSQLEESYSTDKHHRTSQLVIKTPRKDALFDRLLAAS